MATQKENLLSTSLASLNTVFFNNCHSFSRETQVQHIIQTNFFRSTGYLFLIDYKIFFADLKNQDIRLPVSSKNIQEAHKIHELASKNTLVDIEGQIMQNACIQGHHSPCLMPFFVQVSPSEYRQPICILSIDGDGIKLDYNYSNPVVSNSFTWCDFLNPETANVESLLFFYNFPGFFLSLLSFDPFYFKNKRILLSCIPSREDQAFCVVDIIAIADLSLMGDEVCICSFLLSRSFYHAKHGRFFSPKFLPAEQHSFINNDTGEKFKRDYAPKKNKRKSISTGLRRSILERDGFTCCDCGASPQKDKTIALHIDHKIPVAKGGTNAIDNLQTLCDKCNLGKRTDLDWKLTLDCD